MRSRERLEIAIQTLQAKGLCKGDRRFVVLRFLWSLGLQVRPRVFNSFAVNLITETIICALIIGLMKWLLPWTPTGLAGAIQAVTLGAFVGTCLAFEARRLKKKHHLPDWDELHPPANVFD